MQQAAHARLIANRFKEMLQEQGDDIADAHLDELTLLIEAGLDSALIEQLEKISGKLAKVAHSVRHDADFFDT